MDWIERLLHLSPDGGTGTSEAMLLFAVATLIVGVSAGWGIWQNPRGKVHPK